MSGSRSAALAALMMGLVGVIVLGLWVPAGPSAADLLDGGIRSATGWLDPLAAVLNLAGQLPIWATLVGLQAFVVRARPRLAAEIIAVSAAAEALSAVVRLVVDRPRPELAHATDLLIAAGFPSGHVARTVVLGATLLIAVPWLQRRRGAWLAMGLGLVAFMADARILASAHYSSDTLGGVLLGAAVVAAWAVVTRLTHPEEERSPRSR